MPLLISLCPVPEGEVDVSGVWPAPACSPHGSGPQQTLAPVFGGEVGKRRGRNWGPVRADPTSALAHLCVLSLSLFQSGRQKPSVRGTPERTDCCSSVHLSTQLDNLSICPSSWSPALTAGNGWGWNERLIRDQVLPSALLSPLAILEVGWGGGWWGRHRKMEDAALGLRVLMGLFGRMRLTHGGVNKPTTRICAGLNVCVSPHRY